MGLDGGKDGAMRRREFLGVVAAAVGAGPWVGGVSAASARPNILWISAEDIGPLLGCYGDTYASTPHLDRLAAEGVRYTKAFAHAPVCAPSRSGIITGVHPTTLGSHTMRCKAGLPDSVRCFTEYLRDAGYYCSNNRKEDYNFNTPPASWDESSAEAHWRKRGEGQPFFSVFNLTVCHESILHAQDEELRGRLAGMSPEQAHDPAKARIPAYHPDIPEFREAWARYYDSVSSMDGMAGAILQQLEDDGLAEDTIVFFWGDHGTGMPRGKRWVYDSGTRVPLIVKFPTKYAHLAPAAPGEEVDRLVYFIDFAPTVLSLAGVAVPPHMQGRVFLGEASGEAREYVYFMRDRMDEWYDCIRGVRDGRYRYIRNFEAHVPYDQPLSYLYKAPCMQAWKARSEAGELEGAPALYFRDEKPMEEFYDLEADPDEVNNLAGHPEHQERIAAMRQALFDWMVKTRDLGLVPEAELHRHRAGGPERRVGEGMSDAQYRKILETADMPRREGAVVELKERLHDADPVVRFWAASGLGALKADAEGALGDALGDANPNVALAAAFALTRLGDASAAGPVLLRFVEHEDPWVALYALNMVQRTRGGVVVDAEVLARLAESDHDYVRRSAGILLGRTGD